MRKQSCLDRQKRYSLPLALLYHMSREPGALAFKLTTLSKGSLGVLRTRTTALDNECKSVASSWNSFEDLVSDDPENKRRVDLILRYKVSDSFTAIGP